MSSGLELNLFASVAALPAAARALLAGGFFDNASWYETNCATALPAGAVPAFVVLARAGQAVAVVPMLRRGATLSALTTPYTCRWRPLGQPNLADAEWHAVGGQFARWCRPWGTVRLDAMNPADGFFAPFLAGARAAGLAVLPFDHFGNWHIALNAPDWAAYLATRPGELRATIQRRTRKLLGAGAVFRCVQGGPELENAIADYERVYARSWKQAEPFPAFNPALIRTCAANGSLRLGILTQSGAAIAVQLWVVQGNWAAVLKLAHDEQARAAAPGTVLSALMIEHLLGQDRVTQLDFGRGDDGYKAGWTGARRQMVGVVLANPWRPSGFAAIARQAVKRWVGHAAISPVAPNSMKGGS